MTDDLKRTNDSEEQATQPTSDEKQAVEPTPTEPIETPSEPAPETYPKEKVAELISAAEGAVQSAKDIEKAALRRQHRQDIQTLKASHEEAMLSTREKEELERFGDTEPDLVKEIQDLRRRTIATATQTGDVQMHGLAYKFGKKHGVDPEVLLDSASPEEMEAKAKELTQVAEKDAVKALEDRNKQLEDELAIAKKAPQKIDSGASDASGVDWSKLTPDEKIQRGLDKK